MENELDTPRRGTSTYCPDDNKLRFYADARLDKEDYDTIKAAGFRWAPKQELFVKPRWTPQAEDLMIKWCGSIEDEDQTPEERSADRAERFSLYIAKRREEAGTYAHAYESGPAVHGFQSQNKAEVSARRHDRQRVNAYSQWDKAEYWQTRTASVIGHALYKAAPAVRRSRILRIEKDLRTHTKNINEAIKNYKLFKKLEFITDEKEAFKFAYTLANYLPLDWGYVHPRKEGRKTSLYSLLTDGEDPITGKEAADLYLKNRKEPSLADSRWVKHYNLRISYENQMLEAQGGSAANAEMVPGGFIGKRQIIRVNRSPLTKKAVSVVMMAPRAWHNGPGEAPIVEQSFNIQRLGADAYRAPTPEELKSFNKEQAEKKLIKKAGNALKPKLINPTLASAQRLQDIWNEEARESYARMIKRQGCGSVETFDPTEILKLTQAQYALRSKGAYACFEVVQVTAEGERHQEQWINQKAKTIICKIRNAYNSQSNFTHASHHVIVITDKPQKELPPFVDQPLTVKKEATV